MTARGRRSTRPPSALYVCYLPLDEPLVHTQVLAYLRGLAARGHRIHLLTFEVRRLTRAARRDWRERLREQGIVWHSLRYHKRPSLPATIYDTLAGALATSIIVRRNGLDAIHARLHVPAAMALLARRLVWPRRPALIFDIRGLMAQEYVDAGRWKEGGLAWRLTEAVQRAMIARARGVVVLTDRVRRQLFGPSPPPTVHVIPCCADIDALAAMATCREPVRRSLGLTDAPVMIYVGKFGGWYMTDAMAAFFVAAKEALPDLRFLVLTQTEPEEIRDALSAAGASPSDCIIKCVPHDEVGAYLAASDFGISFIEPAPSKASSSPTKVGEYLAAGLPVLTTAGVGDLDSLIGPEVGVRVDRHDRDAYVRAASDMRALLADAGTPQRCRALAKTALSLQDVGIPRYAALYDQVGASPA